MRDKRHEGQSHEGQAHHKHLHPPPATFDCRPFVCPSRSMSRDAERGFAERVSPEEIESSW